MYRYQPKRRIGAVIKDFHCAFRHRRMELFKPLQQFLKPFLPVFSKTSASLASRTSESVETGSGSSAR